ncbi:hypothetical protein [Streptomyces sp. NBC_00102]|uniref:hypothetical protein n=1 Tax=Streptomyces sp. NBC_00102 TaxID=2975652 RepID=UPI00224E22D4|nr:hypothetical protein [Streptomyces sp. NBC_00102]MCX5400804.1 hypothetical protein [Streptomyces sp. NBC_00102]
MLDVRLTARQSISLGRHPSGTAPRMTYHHIPGQTLRGALAKVWITEFGEPHQVGAGLRSDFIALFEGAVQYGPLYATGSYVVPLSVLRCKYGACDTVVDEAFPGAGAESPYCACGPLVPGKGEVEFTGAFTGRPVVQTSHPRIDPATGVAGDGLLFTRRALSARDARGNPRVFRGRVASVADLPPSASEWLARERRLWIGARLSTSGAADWSTRPAPVALPSTGLRIALRLVAPTVLTDDSGLPVDVADRSSLRAVLDAQLAPLLGGVRVESVDGVWTRRERKAGWHAVSRLPKPADLAISAGSVLVLRFDREPAPEALLALCGRGIGLRRREGFGVVETATAAWEQPSTDSEDAGPARTTSARKQAEAYASLLHGTGHSMWFSRQLRPYVEELALRPDHRDTSLLERPRLRRLTGEQRHGLERMLREAPVEVLDLVLSALEDLHLLIGKGASQA